MTKLNANEFGRIIGANCRAAREWSGVTTEKVMIEVFNCNDKTQKNRISEIETGQKPLNLISLHRMCMLYGCSADYILGLSNEFEPNLASSHNGLIVQNMREMGLEIGDRISESLNSLLQFMPKFEGELLKTSAKHLVDAIDKHAHDLAFKAEHHEIVHLANQLRDQVRLFDTVVAKFTRAAELNMIQQLEGFEKSNNCVTDLKVAPVPLNPNKDC